MEIPQKLFCCIWILLIVEESVESAAVAVPLVSGCNNCGTGNCGNCGNDNNLLQKIQNLQNRIDSWETNYGNCRFQCSSFETNLAAQIQKEQQDFNTLRTSCNEFQSSIQILQGRMTGINGRIDGSFERIGACETGCSDCTVRVIRLEGVNQLMKSNFRNFNKTISEIKRTIKTTTNKG